MHLWLNDKRHCERSEAIYRDRLLRSLRKLATTSALLLIASNTRAAEPVNCQQQLFALLRGADPDTIQAVLQAKWTDSTFQYCAQEYHWTLEESSGAFIINPARALPPPPIFTVEGSTLTLASFEKEDLAYRSLGSDIQREFERADAECRSPEREADEFHGSARVPASEIPILWSESYWAISRNEPVRVVPDQLVLWACPACGKPQAQATFNPATPAVFIFRGPGEACPKLLRPAINASRLPFAVGESFSAAPLDSRSRVLYIGGNDARFDLDLVWDSERKEIRYFRFVRLDGAYGLGKVKASTLFAYQGRRFLLRQGQTITQLVTFRAPKAFASWIIEDQSAPGCQ